MIARYELNSVRHMPIKAQFVTDVVRKSEYKLKRKSQNAS